MLAAVAASHSVHDHSLAFPSRQHWIDLLESVKEDYRLPSNFDATIADMIWELEQLVASPRLRTVDVMMVHGFDSNAYRRLNSAAPPRDITLPSVSEVGQMRSLIAIEKNDCRLYNQLCRRWRCS